jgi:glyoxylase-like metal-dependent hydrolase (beta-lactamase superfamily II)
MRSWPVANTDDSDVIHPVRRWLSPEVPLTVHLVTGANYAALIDTGVADMFADIRDLVVRSLPDSRRVKLILNTHAHHDHIGCNAGLSELTGALVATSGDYAAWHVDFDTHYREMAQEHPDLIPDTPQLRAEILDTIDAPHPVDLPVTEGQVVDLGGGVILRALSLPGHMPGELGFVEQQTRTLILGDSLTGTSWSFFHGYSDVAVYVATLARMRDVITREKIQLVRAAHYEAMTSQDALRAIERIADGMAAVDTAIRQAAVQQPEFTLGQMWATVSQSMHKAKDFRGLRVVQAHLSEFAQQGAVREVSAGVYRWSAD